MKYGYFDDKNREYVITNPKTPVKWTNYVGTLAFGGIVDHTGGGVICKGDPALNRITKYIPQMPSSDFKGETLYIRIKKNDGYKVFSPFFVPTLDAYDKYRKLWSDHPTSEHADEAEQRLDELEAQGTAAPRTPRAWQRRGDELFRAHLNERALASYEKAIELGQGKSPERRALKQRAHALFRMRRYPQAVEAFAALPDSAEQRLWHARSLARADRVPESTAALEKLASEGHGEIGLRSTYLAGLLLDGRDLTERAQTNFERVARSRSYPGLAHGALWRLAWREYLYWVG